MNSSTNVRAMNTTMLKFCFGVLTLASVTLVLHQCQLLDFGKLSKMAILNPKHFSFFMNIYSPDAKSMFQHDYVINEKDKCKNEEPFLVLLVISSNQNKEARDVIRKTWGSVRRVQVNLSGNAFVVNITRVFLLGRLSSPVQEEIEKESQEYHDIVQQDFLDTYRNLTLKTMMGLQWLMDFCPQASYALKIDTDMFFNPENLVEIVLRPDLPVRSEYLTGVYMEGFSPIRNVQSKWYVSEDVYPSNNYPPFCSGTTYVFSTDLASKILQVAPNVTYVDLEDVFMGLCLNKMGIKPQRPPKEGLFHAYFVAYTPCVYRRIITSHGVSPNQLLLFWEGVRTSLGEKC
uniref:beta-1,3-galactosyltransferase 2-like isoform X1 n=1 Tax=Myxine glutinosa TaxID=7769 RepID=UPI00358E25A5